MRTLTPDEIRGHVAEIADVGYTIVHDAIEPDLVDELVADLERLEVELGVAPSRNDFEGEQTVRIYNLLVHGPTFERVPVHPNVLPVVEGVLDDGCLISSLSSIAICEGETPQPIHADDQLMPMAKPHPPTVCNSMWALTDFTEANGATRIVPGSHLATESPTYGEAYDSIPAEMPCGAVLVWHGSLWHGGGANTTSQRRVGLAMNYCAGYIRQQENQQLGIPRDIAAGFDERLQRLCGYGVYRGLIGHIDKHDPVELLRDEEAVSSMVWDATRPPSDVSTAGITDEDERLHPVEDPSPHWSDSLYFNAWDPATSAFVMTRIAVRANAGQVTAGMIVWVDGTPVYGYARELAEVPPTDWDVMAVDGLTYRMLEAGGLWAVQLADGEAKAHLEWRGRSPATHYGGHPAGALPKAVAWGHYEQTCRVTGDLDVGGQRIRFDGHGQRDHSWGHRHWARLHEWHWVTGFLADGRAFNLFEVLAHDGTTTINGYVHGPDGDEWVVASSRELQRSEDGGTEHVRVLVQRADGTAIEVTGDRAGLSIPVRPAPDDPVTVHETPMRLLANGVEGYGIYEHLVTDAG